jgi:single-strand DNA-binding protein
MINEAQVFLAGYVAREPKFRLTRTGVSVTTLRVGFTPRRVDRETGEWSDGTSSFVTVICWRGLADNVATCVRKGEPVLVKGRLQVRPYDKDGVSRLAVEIEASSVGHDLTRGVANFRRALRPTGETALGFQSAGGPDDPPGAADPLAGSPVPAGGRAVGGPILDGRPGEDPADDPADADGAALAGEVVSVPPPGDEGDEGEDVVLPASLSAPF